MIEQESILLSIKKLLGMDRNYNAFDTDIIININSVLMILWQLGVGVGEKPFAISGEKETWSDFLANSSKLELVKTYIYMKVKLIFDPPSSGVLHEAIERQIQEFEWRLNIQSEGGYADATEP